MAKQNQPAETETNPLEATELSSQNTDHLWTVDDVARYLRLEPETVRAKARRGELPAIKLGRIWRFRKSKVYELVKNVESQDA